MNSNESFRLSKLGTGCLRPNNQKVWQNEWLRSASAKQKYVEAFALIDASRIDEVAHDIKQGLAKQADAALTGAELLAKIVSEVRKA
jgi:hypothetical protein